MRQGVLFSEITCLIEARLALLITQNELWKARVLGLPHNHIGIYEENVKFTLDRLWEAQQRAS